MKLDRAALHDACRELARSIRWKDNPIDRVVADALVPALVEDALFHEEFLIGQGRDPNIIVRAVRYLAHKHAIPPLEGNNEWFRSMLEVLIELACPNQGVESEHLAFFLDIEQGIREARQDT